MLTIKLEENPQNALSEMGITVETDSFVMTMCDGDELMGVGVMKLFYECAELCGVYIKEEFNDFSLNYGMGKSLLNAIDLRGIKNVYSDNADMEVLLKSLKFKKYEDCEVPEEIGNHLYYLNLTGYFDANC